MVAAKPKEQPKPDQVVGEKEMAPVATNQSGANKFQPLNQPDPDKKGVVYKGVGSRREITSADFKAVGIEHKTLVWSSRNGKVVPMDQITDDAVFDIIEQDPNFEIRE